MYCSTYSLMKWINYVKKYIEELHKESGGDNIYDILHDDEHDGYIREFKSYLKAIIEELDIEL